jgi:hypothetical protein
LLVDSYAQRGDALGAGRGVVFNFRLLESLLQAFEREVGVGGIQDC